MSKRQEMLNEESLSSLFRHHPYLQLLQKENWRDYLQVLARIYDLIESGGGMRISIDEARAVAVHFFSRYDLSFLDQKVTSFFAMAIGDLQVLKDSHDQFGARYIEPTRAGKSLLQLIEALLSQRLKFSGTGAETLLGALNDILLGRKEMTLNDALAHHRDKINSYKEDIARIKEEGLQAAQLLPMAHSNEALFNQAEESAIGILASIEEVKTAIEEQRRDLASGYFKKSGRSMGETLGAVADFYAALYLSPQYESYTQAKELLSHLEGFEARFALRNVDRLLHSIDARGFVDKEKLLRSNLRGFMHQFRAADSSIQDQIKAQMHILQQQVLYSISNDIEGLRSALQALLSTLVAHPSEVIEFCGGEPLHIRLREEFEPGPVGLCDFELPAEGIPVELEEEDFDLAQERELFLALLRAEEGTLKDILRRLSENLRARGELRARAHDFPNGLAEYYVLSEIGLFSSEIDFFLDGEADLKIESARGCYVLRRAPAFVLRLREPEVCIGQA